MLYLPTDGASGLAGLELDLLILVTNSLALVRIGRPNGANPGRYLADEFFVDSADHDTGRQGKVKLDAAGRRHVDRVRVPNL